MKATPTIDAETEFAPPRNVLRGYSLAMLDAETLSLRPIGGPTLSARLGEIYAWMAGRRPREVAADVAGDRVLARHFLRGRRPAACASGKRRNVLQALRDFLGTTQAEIGALGHRSWHTVASIETGRLELSEHFAAHLSNACGIDFAWLANGDATAPMRNVAGEPYGFADFARAQGCAPPAAPESIEARKAYLRGRAAERAAARKAFREEARRRKQIEREARRPQERERRREYMRRYYQKRKSDPAFIEARRKRGIEYREKRKAAA